ncbi:hypothetical protein LXL04_027883 [Taraxacum kok-saghyz]
MANTDKRDEPLTAPPVDRWFIHNYKQICRNNCKRSLTQFLFNHPTNFTNTNKFALISISGVLGDGFKSSILICVAPLQALKLSTTVLGDGFNSSISGVLVDIRRGKAPNSSNSISVTGMETNHLNRNFSSSPSMFEKSSRPMLGRKELFKNSLRKVAYAWKLINDLNLSGAQDNRLTENRSRSLFLLRETSNKNPRRRYLFFLSSSWSTLTAGDSHFAAVGSSGGLATAGEEARAVSLIGLHCSHSLSLNNSRDQFPLQFFRRPSLPFFLHQRCTPPTTAAQQLVAFSTLAAVSFCESNSHRERRKRPLLRRSSVFSTAVQKPYTVTVKSCLDLLRTHIFPRTRELPQFPISPKPLFLSKNRLRNPPKPVLKQNKKLCTYAQKKSLHICKVFGKKNSFFRKFFFATGLIFERFLASRSRFFEKVNGLGVLGEVKMRKSKMLRKRELISTTRFTKSMDKIKMG